MPAALKVVSGPLGEGRVLLLPSSSGAPFLLGRSLEADLTLGGPEVEDRQAVLIAERGAHRLVPLAAQAPVRVDERPLTAARVLGDGDRLRIGKHVLVYVADSERVPLAAAAGWGAGSRGTDPGAPCAACREPLGPASGDALTLAALRIGGEVVCPRCVDLRLQAARDLDSYRVLRKIGTNPEEVTYLAVDRETNERVALRILKADRQADPGRFRRFLCRALVGLTLDHPSYLAVKAIRSTRGITFVVLEHLEQSAKLEAFVREAAPVPLTDAIYLTNQLAEVLRYARERQLVVAKRKKSGVLVDARLWVKVLAFDITAELEAQAASTAAFAELARQSGEDPERLAAAVVTPRTPEEERLSRLASEFAEVYSVGRILYQLVTGAPFSPAAIDIVREANASVRGGAVQTGPLRGRSRAEVDLLDRVLDPRGEGRIRTLEGYTRASKTAFAAAATVTAG